MSNEEISKEKPKKSFWKRWPFIIFASFIALILAVWFGGWFVIANLLESSIESAFEDISQQGQDLECSELSTNGFPIQMQVICESLTVSVGGQQLFSIQELRGKVSIFNPTEFIVKAEAPLVATVPNANLAAPINGKWELVQASTNISDFGFNVQIDSANFLVGDVFEVLRLGEFETSGGFRGESSSYGYHFALRVRDLLPNLVGVSVEQPGNIDINIKVPIDEATVDGPSEKILEGYLKQGGEVQVEQVNLSMGGAEIALGGEMNFNESGYLNGDLKLWLGNYERLVQLLQYNLTDYSEMIEILLPTIISGFPTEDRNGVTGKEIPIKIVNGSISVGVFPLGEIPPLTQMQHN